MKAEEARKRAETNARRSNAREHKKWEKERRAESAKAMREAKKVLPRVQAEIRKSVRQGSRETVFLFLNEAETSALRTLLHKDGYHVHYERDRHFDGYGDTTRITW